MPPSWSPAGHSQDGLSLPSAGNTLSRVVTLKGGKSVAARPLSVIPITATIQESKLNSQDASEGEGRTVNIQAGPGKLGQQDQGKQITLKVRQGRPENPRRAPMGAEGLVAGQPRGGGCVHEESHGIRGAQFQTQRRQKQPFRPWRPGALAGTRPLKPHLPARPGRPPCADCAALTGNGVCSCHLSESPQGAGGPASLSIFSGEALSAVWGP